MIYAGCLQDVLRGATVAAASVFMARVTLSPDCGVKHTMGDTTIASITFLITTFALFTLFFCCHFSCVGRKSFIRLCRRMKTLARNRLQETGLQFPFYLPLAFSSIERFILITKGLYANGEKAGERRKPESSKLFRRAFSLSIQVIQLGKTIKNVKSKQ